MVFADVDPISGWAQVVLQFGALGIVGIIIYYFPGWMNRLLDASATERTALLNAFKEEQRLERLANTESKRLDRLENAEAKRETVKAIEQQTLEFKEALKACCRFQQPDQRSR